MTCLMCSVTTLMGFVYVNIVIFWNLRSIFLIWYISHIKSLQVCKIEIHLFIVLSVATISIICELKLKIKKKVFSSGNI